MLDDVARFNRERWGDLVRAGVLYSRPYLDLDEASAWDVVDAEGVMRHSLGDVRGREVLCLASGGGQQSAAFALLGANVTVTDLTPEQLEQDRRAAERYGVNVRTVEGDMRDLSAFADACFDVAWQAYSINFVPSVEPVFAEVARVLRPGGLYRVQFLNPFFAELDDASWNGKGYLLGGRYVDGEIDFSHQPFWDVEDEQGVVRKVPAPREFRHTLRTMVNGLVARGFLLLGTWEERAREPDPPPGDWEHVKLVAPPWLTFWAMYHPEVMERRFPSDGD